jgi:hypothetical protein
VDVPGLTVHTTTGTAVLADLLPYLAIVGRPMAITISAYYAIRTVVFLVVTVVAVCTKNDKRREACLQIVQAVSGGWPWSARLPRDTPGG